MILTSSYWRISSSPFHQYYQHYSLSNLLSNSPNTIQVSQRHVYHVTWAYFINFPINNTNITISQILLFHWHHYAYIQKFVFYLYRKIHLQIKESGLLMLLIPSYTLTALCQFIRCFTSYSFRHINIFTFYSALFFSELSLDEFPKLLVFSSAPTCPFIMLCLIS
jgi:hypothetical protein